MCAATMAALSLTVVPAAHADDEIPLAVKVTACQTGADPAERVVVFNGSIPVGDEASRVGMRFELLERRAGSDTFKRVKVPSFGTWQKSDPGVPGFVVEKRIDQLRPGSDYKVAVKFRWYARNGKVQRQVRRVSAACHQPDVRPDLRVRSISSDPPAEDGSITYRVTVRNLGETAVLSPFAVSLTVNGTLLPAGEPIPSLQPGAATVISFNGPKCAAGQLLRATVDTTDAVDEATEDDNVFERACAQR